jgi:alkanesulfonate monooxygenase SsuD/methylene tetrahydromethanopterin reductase-like flavin-dependent oxidoreductase (luciferase family)
MMIVPHGQRMDRTREFVRTYRTTWRESGFRPGAEQVQVALFAYLAETHEEALRGFEAPARRYIEVLTEAVGGWSTARSAQYPGYDQLMQAIAALTPEALVENHLAYVGTPAKVIEQVRWHRDFFGEIEPSMQINFGGIGDGDAFRTLELFAAGVLPKFNT